MSYAWRRAPWMCFDVRICPSMKNYTPAPRGIFRLRAAKTNKREKHSLTASFSGLTIGLCPRTTGRRQVPPQRVEKVRLWRPFPSFNAVSLSALGPPGRETAQGILAQQGFRIRRTGRRIRIAFGGLRPSKPPGRVFRQSGSRQSRLFFVSKRLACVVLLQICAVSPSPCKAPCGKRRQETWLHGAFESAAQVAGFGWRLEDCGPPTRQKLLRAWGPLNPAPLDCMQFPIDLRGKM